MDTMDYKEKFEKLIQRIDDLIANGWIGEKAGKAILKDFTVESEDERIRKDNLDCIKYMKPNFCHHEVDFSDCSEEYIKAYYDGWNNCNQQHAQLEAEQKPTDKVESKFKVGDWCIDNEDGTIFQIVKVLNNTYTYKTNEGYEYSCTHYSLENDAHLWTIQDAKPGDVLVDDENNIGIFESFGSHPDGGSNNDDSYCYLFCKLSDGFFYPEFENNTIMYSFCGIYPANMEQRDLLFQKMKEAGYEWNAEKKVLKKIEQKDICETCEHPMLNCVNFPCNEALQQEKRAEWSEEDEKMWSQVINEIEAIKSNSLTIFEKNIAQDKIDWLNSLKEREQPKTT